MKLWDIISNQLFDNVASGTQLPNEKIAQDIQLTDDQGNPIYLSIDNQGNVGVNVNGVTFNGNFTVNNIQLIDALNAIINPATKENQATLLAAINSNNTSLSSLITTNQTALIAALLNQKVSPNLKLATSYNTVSTTINAGNNGFVTITPPSGYILEIVGLNISIPVVTGASSGTQSVYIYGGVYTVYGQVTAAYNKAFMIRGFGPQGYDTIIPNSEGAFVNSILGARFNNANPLTIQYFNNSNVSTANSASRTYTILYKLVAENTGF